MSYILYNDTGDSPNKISSIVVIGGTLAKKMK